MERHTALRPSASPRRVIKVAVKDESELVVRGIQAMLAPFVEQVVVVGARPGQPTPIHDLMLYEPSRRGSAAGRILPGRVAGRMVAYSWDCAPEVVSTEMALGATGFISKWVPARRLVRDLLQLADGRVVVDAWDGRETTSDATEQDQKEWPLTPRETTVLSLIAAGRSNLEIAADEHLSINSVKSYIRSAYAKIEVSSRSQAVLWAVRHGLLLSTDADRALVAHR